MLRMVDVAPICRAEHRSFCREQPVRGRHGCRTSAEGQKPRLLTLDKSEEHRTQAAIGSPFLWLLSFGEAKESNSLSGAINPIQITVALATPY